MNILFAESLWGGKVLSSADVLLTMESFGELRPKDSITGQRDYEPKNRLLMDPVLQFQPWLKLNREMLRQGRLPLWNDLAGCGTPHLANCQSALFDPFHLIAYLGPWPDSLAWMAAIRLWTAGLGMFVLGRVWGMSRGGRWFAGLTYPFSGFLIVWLPFPVASAAVWLPWLMVALENLAAKPRLRSASWLGLAIGAVLLAGHIQTSAHVLLAAGLRGVWLCVQNRSWIISKFGCLGVTWGLVIGAIGYVPLAFYLPQSPIWGDRLREHPPFWVMERPRLLEPVNLALPYLYGSQRQGQPNLGRGLGVDNVNESAGGFVGLAALLVLAPVGLRGRSGRYLAVLAVVGLLGSLQWPPVSNILRAIPFLQVMDHRRLSLWIAFALTALAGLGWDRLGVWRRSRWSKLWAIVCGSGGVCLILAGLAAFWSRPWLEPRIQHHYQEAARAEFGGDAKVYQMRADRQIKAIERFVPWYCGISAVKLLGLGWVLLQLRKGQSRKSSALWILTLIQGIDLAGFAWSFHPSIPQDQQEPRSQVVERLTQQVGDQGRILGLGAEWIPNSLSRYGLADPRNYDSIELSRALDRLESIYESDARMRSSRRLVTWNGVARGLAQLKAAGVQAIVSPVRPPDDLAKSFSKVEQVGSVWITLLETASPLIELKPMPRSWSIARQTPGRLEVVWESDQPVHWIWRQSFEKGWRLRVNGQDFRFQESANGFLETTLPAGQGQAIWSYEPTEVFASLGVSAIGLVLATLVLVVGSMRRAPSFFEKNREKSGNQGFDGSP